MINIDELKKIANPFSTISPNISKSEFIGRATAIDTLIRELDNYVKTSRIKNILIRGEKSVGKSTLLKRYRDILHDYNFVVYEKELTRNEKNIDEFEFFKELFDDLFRRYAPPEGDFFDSEQSEIWFELTSGTYTHKSNFKERLLGFATQYSSKKNGYDEKLNYKQLENDFNGVLNELLSRKMDFRGLAIIIDEFQELSNNILLLDVLRKLSENLVGVTIIGAGIPRDLNDAVFEKFIRTSNAFNLKNFNNEESIELIFKPILANYKCSRYEIEKIFDHSTLLELLERTEGNPLHIRILCSKLFESFQNDPTAKIIQISRKVMDDVMEYYSNISDESRKIKNALETCSKEQLEVFSRVYYYEGFNIRASVLDELAFNSIQNEEEERIKFSRINDLKEIFDLGLFELNDGNIKISELEKMTINELSQVSYRFIGSPIDKLYATYFYEDLTKEKLTTPEPKDFEKLLLIKLSDDISNSIRRNKIPADSSPSFNEVFKISFTSRETIKEETLIKELDYLKKFKSNDEPDEATKKELGELAEKLDLRGPAVLASVFQFEGYYLLTTSVSIRGKEKILYNYFPIKGTIDKVINIREKIIDYSSVVSASIEEYSVKINWMYLNYIPKQPFLTIYYIDLNDEHRKLVNLVKDRNFEEAVRKSELLFNLNLKRNDEKLFTHVDHYNDYGFCLCNVGSIKDAKEIFENIQNKLLVSRINLAYIYYIEDKLVDAKKILKDILKKKVGLSTALYLHLAIKNNKLDAQYKIAEGVYYINVVCWNLALIAAQEGSDSSIINSFLKNVRKTPNDQIYDSRVRYWIDYYKDEKENALKQAKKLLKQISSYKNIFDDVKKDIEIFTTEKTI